jgi:hypothetical protein
MDALGLGLPLPLNRQSLDLATGPLVNFGGASAAYSLRDLNGQNPMVVRVRRESDNNERDFNQDTINSGDMVRWVNEQITPPLDLRELTATGRDGPIIDAAAAYSLRNLSDSYTGNVVDVRRSSDDAPSGFTAAEVADGTLVAWVGAGNDGFVSQWYDQSTTSGTPNANHAVQTDAASQPKIVDAGVLVTDRDGKVALNGKGAKLDLPTNAPMLSTDGTYSLFAVVDFDDQRNGNDNFNNILWFDSTTAGGAASTRKPLVYLNQSNGLAESTGPSYTQGSVYAPAAETLSVQLFTNIANPALPTGNNTLYVDGALAGYVNDPTNIAGYANDATSVNTNNLLGSSSQIFDSQETTVTHFLSEVIYYPSDQSANRTAIEANIGEVYSIASIPAYADTVNGFVETWYDQSGNGNNATQLTASQQPKIVNAGVLVSGGLDFLTGQSFDVSISVTRVHLFSVFRSPNPIVHANAVHLIDDTQTFQTLHFSVQAPTKYTRFSGFVYTQDVVSMNTDGTDNLVSALNQTAVQGGSSLHINGSPMTIATTDTNSSMVINRIGKSLWSNVLNQVMAEWIVYDSDQSANREAIEANINNQYDIY